MKASILFHAAFKVKSCRTNHHNINWKSTDKYLSWLLSYKAGHMLTPH